MYDEMLKFVKDTLTERGGIKSKNIYHPFRNRYEHTKRVFKWLERIMPDCPNCDRDVAAIATIFHDVGYGGNEFKTHHAERSTIIFRKYAQDNLDLPKEKLEQIEQIILCHSDKSLILNEKSSDELVLMLEADLLDEEGALGIAFDLLSAGAKMPTSYQNGLLEIMSHTAHIMGQNPMKTPIAKKYWEEKKQLVKTFIDAYSFDME